MSSVQSAGIRARGENFVTQDRADVPRSYAERRPGVHDGIVRGERPAGHDPTRCIIQRRHQPLGPELVCDPRFRRELPRIGKRSITTQGAVR